jgi:NAD(P)-dependent dehydrogenase (short-subunit alcohol dehydrogenase family)
VEGTPVARQLPLFDSYSKCAHGTHCHEAKRESSFGLAPYLAEYFEEKLLSSAGDVRPIHLDLADEATLKSAVVQIEREQGRLDLLINNAGIALLGDTPESIRTVFQTNLHGPVLLTQLCVPLLRKSAAARVVNVSSAAGQFSFLASDRLTMDPEKLYYAYPVSKTALNAATVLLANALQREVGIRVNACCPGMTATKVSRSRAKARPKVPPSSFQWLR